MALTTYGIHCIRSGDWWAVEVPKVPGVHTQARRLDQAETMAREAIALMLDVEPDSFAVEFEDVQLTPALDTAEIQHELVQLRRARQDAEEAQAMVAGLTRDVATKLVDVCGLTVRDAGRLMGVSHQRVAQILAEPQSTARAR